VARLIEHSHPTLCLRKHSDWSHEYDYRWVQVEPGLLPVWFLTPCPRDRGAVPDGRTRVPAGVDVERWLPTGNIREELWRPTGDGDWQRGGLSGGYSDRPNRNGYRLSSLRPDASKLKTIEAGIAADKKIDQDEYATATPTLGPGDERLCRPRRATRAGGDQDSLRTAAL
jgi:hypothetical protein